MSLSSLDSWLSTSPWRVDRVGLDPEEQQVDLWLAHRRNAIFTCPECGTRSPLHDHLPFRKWRHLDHGGCVTWLHARHPGSTAPSMASTKSASPGPCRAARFTIPFERHAIDVLLQTDVLGSARLLRISWDEAWHLMERAVDAGPAGQARRVMAQLGVDEKAVAKGHRYVTLVFDLDRSTVEYIADDRKKTSLDAYYQSLSKEQLAGIEAVAMDMWEPFFASTVDACPRRPIQDRLRSLPCDEAHDGGGRCGAEVGAPPPASGGGRDPEEDEIPVAVLGGEPAGVVPGAVRGPACAAPEDGASLGDQGVVARSVGVPAPGLGAAALEATGTSGRRTRA